MATRGADYTAMVEAAARAAVPRAHAGLPTAAVLTLMLGIGAVATAFTLVYGVLLEPLPYGQPDRLVSVGLALRSADLRRIQQPPASTSPIDD